jgi:small subunit ribosomal protein S16
MATRIRLQRHGKKNKAFFHLVAADSRAKRDGKFIEKLGTYNPNTNPATIDINFEKTLTWVQNGAEMSDTARAILSYKGVLYKNHLIKGVKKGALTAEQVEIKFAEWLAEKDAKVSGKKDSLSKKADEDKASRLKAEIAVNEAKAKEIEAKNTVEEEVVEEAEETATESVESVEEVASEETASEEQPASEEATEESASEE